MSSKNCWICGHPAHNGSGMCFEDYQSVEKARRERRERDIFYRQKRDIRLAHSVVMWRGMAFKVTKSPNNHGMVKVERVELADVNNLPRTVQIINLDCYCPGFDRGQIKRMKATMLRLNSEHVEPEPVAVRGKT